MSASAILMLSAALFAQEGDERTRAAGLLDEGNQLFEAKDFGAALEKYQAAYDTFPSAKIYFNIGEAKRELGRSVEAANAYASFIADALVDAASPIGAKARERLDELDRNVGRLTFEGDLAGTELSVDGRPVGQLPMRELRVEVGTHHVRAARLGAKPFESEITANAGASTPIWIAFEPIEIHREPELTQVTTKPPEGDDPTKQWWFWTAIGGAAAVVVLVTVIAVSSGGSDRLPEGELPASSTARDWMKL